MVGVCDDAIDGADFNALRSFEMTDALGTQARVDDIEFFALSDRLVWTLRLTDIAVDTFFGDH